ncbi:abasic site processing protein HMCES isoform X2 [Mastacembelus armatus]|uniref:abasic site processing protein HMCES isoform X2 n=1 Tax=Mastacembelus armatus TaxID=205130 RepID=UPI000E462F87|nr:abasic site processing protein HMCES isoform X2 [Mastacembelus armatus]
MCGRTACTLAPDEISRACSYRSRGGQRRQPRWRDGDAEKYRPSYNKSPQSMSPVLLSQRHFDKDPMLKGQRCVILADGFYEWKKMEKDKQPFFIYFPQTRGPGQVKREDQEDTMGSAHNMGNLKTACSREALAEEGEAPGEWTGWRLLTMAGLFDCWNPPGGGEPLYSYSVITVNASPNLQSIHDRMPAILDGEEEVRKWLNYGEVKCLDALKLLQSKNILTFHPVSSLVSNSRNNSPECLQPVDLHSKKESKPTAGSKMMKSWLMSGSPLKRKGPNTCEIKDHESKSQTQKSTGSLQQWLHGANKKPRIN